MDEPTSTRHRHTSSPIAQRQQTIALVLLLAAVLLVPTALGRTNSETPFDQSLVSEVTASQPQIVFLGNSLLDTRINPELFAESTGLQTLSLATDGTAPGVWYLQLANVVAASGAIPERVVVFFHDDLITRPVFFTGSTDQQLLESLMKPVDELPKLPQPPESWKTRLSEVFVDLYPIAQTPNRRDLSIPSAFGASLAGLSEREMTISAANLTEPANQRKLAERIQQPKFHGEFTSLVDDSFLPLIIQFAKDLDVKLTLVRVAARPNSDGSPNDPENLARYSQDLAAYLYSAHVDYIDMTRQVESGNIDAAMYYDGYHLKRRFLDSYTEAFADLFSSGTNSNVGDSQ